MTHQQRQPSIGWTRHGSRNVPTRTIGSRAMVIPGRSRHPGTRSAIIRHLWSFVHFLSNAVTGVFTDDLEALALHKLLDRRRNITRLVASAHLCDASIKRLLGHLKKFAGFGEISPTPAVKAESPTYPSTTVPQSIETISPSLSLRFPGMPCTSSSLTLAHIDAGKGGCP